MDEGSKGINVRGHFHITTEQSRRSLWQVEVLVDRSHVIRGLD